MDLGALERILATNGEPLLLRRLVGQAQVSWEVRVVGRVIGYQPEELVGLVQQGDRRVIISNGEIASKQWPGPPRAGDQVYLIAENVTARVEGCETLRVGDAIARHTLRIRGGLG